jgi:uncharacterized protein
MINNEIKSILLTIKEQLLELYNDKLIEVILFGSQARGTANNDSDIDILIVLKEEINIGEEVERTSRIILNLSLQYDKIISRLFMSEQYFKTYQSALLRNIRQEGIIL